MDTYLITFYNETAKEPVIMAVRRMNAHEVIKMGAAHALHLRDEKPFPYPSSKYTVEEIGEMIVDNS